MKSIGEQAKEFRERQGWTFTRMSEEVSKKNGSPVSRQLITQLEQQAGRTPKYLQALAAVMGVSTDALLAGGISRKDFGSAEGELGRAATGVGEEPAPEYAGTMNRIRSIPVIGTARMGDDGHYDEISFAPGAGDGHIDIATADPNAYCLKVRGSSMMPAIRDGWYVLVEPNGQPALGEYVLIKLKNGERMVKELLYQRSDSIEIMSVNGEERRTIYHEDLDGIQAVAAVVSPSKYKPD